MTSRRTPALRWLALAGVLAGIAGCNVAESYRVEMVTGDIPHRPACRSEAGAYSLSTTTWSFQIKTYGDSNGYFLESIEEKHYPDAGHTYCLDYVASAFATDTLAVGYSATGATGTAPRGGLLGYVASFAVDKTAVVIRNLVRAIFVGISGNAQFAVRNTPEPAPPETVLGRFEVDPLDADEMASLNTQLAEYGFCLLLRDYSVAPEISGEEYCRGPEAALARAPSPLLEAAKRQSWLVKQAERSGILYRPRIPYSLEIYAQEDPGHSPWQLRKVTEVKLENLAPIVSLRLNRAIFADARVGLEFDNGVLQNFCLSKTSEAAGFVEIPLDIVYGIVSLPAATLRAEFDRANQSAALVEAETALIQTQRQHVEFLRGKTRPEAGLGNPAASLGNNPEQCSASAFCPSSTQPGPLNVVQSTPDDTSAFNAIGNVCDSLQSKLAAVPGFSSGKQP